MATKEKAVKIVAKKIKDTLIATIDGKKYSKKISNDKELSGIKRKLDLYSKNPSKNNLTNILNIFETKDKKEVIKKGLKKIVKKAAKKAKANKSEVTQKLTNEQTEELIAKNLQLSEKISELENKLKEEAKNETKPVETRTPTRREY